MTNSNLLTLPDYFDASLNKMKKQLGHSRKGIKPDAVHDFRVAYKQLKALNFFIRGIEINSDTNEFGTWLKKIKPVYKKSGRVRNYHVLIKHGLNLNLFEQVPSFEAELRSQLKENSGEFENAIKQYRIPTSKKPRKSLSNYFSGHDFSDHSIVNTFYYRNLTDALDLLKDEPSDDWHLARRLVKSCYLISNAGFLSCPLSSHSKSVIRSLEQDLGLWHDYSILMFLLSDRTDGSFAGKTQATETLQIQTSFVIDGIRLKAVQLKQIVMDFQKMKMD